MTAKTLVTTLIASSFSLGMGVALALDDPEGDIEHIRERLVTHLSLKSVLAAWKHVNW